jgi:ATP-dependent Clp protease ATP-binding subunit ClpA
MFERFSERARRVLFFARDEASQLGSTSIDTEHLLLGLIRENKGLTNLLFADAGIALDDIRDEVLRRVPRAVEDVYISGDPVQRCRHARATARREGSGPAAAQSRRDRAPAARTAP